MQRIKDTYGHIDLLYLNAGKFTKLPFLQLCVLGCMWYKAHAEYVWDSTTPRLHACSALSSLPAVDSGQQRHSVAAACNMVLVSPQHQVCCFCGNHACRPRLWQQLFQAKRQDMVQ